MIEEGGGARAKIFVVRILIFPQIVLDTKAINTNKCMALGYVLVSFQAIVVLRI